MNSATPARPLSAPATQDGGDAPKASSQPRLVEVELQRKYCPHFLVGEDGKTRPNEAEIKEVIQPGIVRLHPEDATNVLRAQGLAVPTNNTFKDM